MVSASALRAKLAGLMVDQLEARVQVSSLDRAESIEEIADALLEGRFNGQAISKRDRVAFVEILGRFSDEMDQFMSAVTAKPVSEFGYDEEGAGEIGCGAVSVARNCGANG